MPPRPGGSDKRDLPTGSVIEGKAKRYKPEEEGMPSVVPAAVVRPLPPTPPPTHTNHAAMQPAMRAVYGAVLCMQHSSDACASGSKRRLRALRGALAATEEA